MKSGHWNVFELPQVDIKRSRTMVGGSARVLSLTSELPCCTTRSSTCCISTQTGQELLKAESHITCRSYAVPLPCRAAKGLERVCPIWFTQCDRVWFTLAMPRPCHPRPCHSSPGHGTAWPSREELWANWPHSASSGYRAEITKLLSDAYQSQMQVASVKPNTVCHGRGKEW